MKDVSDWQTLLRDLWAPSPATEGLLNYLKTGQPEEPPRPAHLDPECRKAWDPVLRDIWWAEKAVHRELLTSWREVLNSDRDGFLRILGAIPDFVLDRVSGLSNDFPSADSWPLSAVLGFSSSSLVTRTDLAQARYGHSAEELVAEMFGANQGRHALLHKHAYLRLQRDDADEWLRQNLDLTQAHLAAEGPNPVAAWSRFDKSTLSTFELVAPELAAAATSRLKTLRNHVRPIARQAGYNTLKESLMEIAQRGNASARLEALRVLRDLVPPDQTADLAEWANRHLADDRSNAVRAELEVLREVPMTFATVTEQIPSEVPIPPELAALIRPFQTVWLTSGRGGNQLNREVLELLNGDRGSDLVRQLELVHIARIVCGVPAVEPTDRQNMRQFVECLHHFPSLVLVEAVIRNDSHFMPTSRVLGGIAALSQQSWISNFWSNDQIGEWVANQLSEINDHLRDEKLGRRVPNLYDLVVPHEKELPESFCRSLLAGAIDGPARQRKARQQAYPNSVVTRVVPFLASAKASTRQSAAEWLEVLRDPVCIDAVVEALAVERSVRVRAVLSRLAERFSERVPRSLAEITSEASAAREGRWSTPKKIDWLDFSAIPNVSSRDGADIDEATIEWVVVTAVKTNDIRPSAAVVDFVSHLHPRDAHGLGDFLLAQWLDEDQRTLSIEEARTLAEEKRVIRGIALTTYRDLEEVMTEILSKPSGTALSSKGLLSVVAACGAPNAGRLVAEYIDHWGISLRKKQCIALIEMLGWTDSPGAIKTVVDVAQGHWLTSVQKQAVLSVRLIAERGVGTRRHCRTILPKRAN